MKRYTSITVLILITAVASIAQTWETAVVGKNLEDYVRYLSSVSLEGRKAGSPGETAAAEYMYDRLSEFGVTMLTPRTGQDFSIVTGEDTLFSRNIVGIVEGYDSILRNQYIVVGANLDHLGSNILTVDGRNVTQIFPGANDNASGVAAVIEVARRVASSSFLFRRSVVFVGFGAKEQGMAGSWYFANRAFKEIDSVSIMLDLRAIGKSGPMNPFTYYTGIPHPEVNRLVAGLSEVGAFYTPVQGDGVVPIGDYLPFYDKNIPVMLLTTGSDRNVRSVKDNADLLDYETMDYICDFIYNFVREAAGRDLMFGRILPVDEAGSEGRTESGERVYSAYEVDVAPQFFKGDVSTFLSDWVYTYLRYPEIPLSQGVSGTVVVEFIVEKDGSVTGVRAVRGEDQYLEDEAVRVIAASPKWKPGQMRGEKVRVKYSVPVEFRLKKRK